MSENIIPISFETTFQQQCHLAEDINGSVRQPDFAKLLKTRHLIGLLKSHSGKVSQSEHNVFTAYKLHQEGALGVFVLKSADSFVGMATVDPCPKLRKQKIGLTPKFAKGPLSTPVLVNGPEITAWINPLLDPFSSRHLASAYRELSQPDGIAKKQFEKYLYTQPGVTEPIQAWTIEPQDTPPWIHHAIQKAGFSHDPNKTGLYDDGQSRRYSPPPSRLYISTPPLY